VHANLSERYLTACSVSTVTFPSPVAIVAANTERRMEASGIIMNAGRKSGCHG
jgi:hypothetical protein